MEIYTKRMKSWRLQSEGIFSSFICGEVRIIDFVHIINFLLLRVIAT